MSQLVSIIDFGSSKITVMIGDRGVNNTLNIAGMGESEYAGFCEGEFFRPDQLGQAIAHAINNAETNAKTRIKTIYVGVPGDFTACICKDVSISFGKRHKITPTDINDLHSNGNEFKDNERFSLINIQPVYYTLGDDRRLIEPVGLYSNKLSGHVSYILAENNFVQTITQIIKSLGIENIEFVSSMLAETLFLFDDVTRDQYVVLMDIGYITTSVLVARGDGILSQHSFSLGGGNISGDLATYFKISFSEAETIKRKVVLSLNMSSGDVYEVGDNRYPAQLVNEIVTARITQMAKAIKKCLSLCEYEYPSHIPYHLTGGGITYIRGAKDILAQELERKVEIVAPKILQLNRPHLSSALGLLDLAVIVSEPQKQGFFSKLFKK